MNIDPATAVPTSNYRDVTYYFCARGCKLDFDEDPDGILAAEAAYDHTRPMEHGVTASTGVASANKPWWRFWKS
jgi:YHS domain-containing protein